MDYLGILDFSPVAQYAIDREHRIVRWNRACEIMTGFPAKEMVRTDHQWQPFYPSKRPMLADIVLEQDTRGLLKYYRGSKLTRSRAVSNAWEKTEFFSDLGGRSRSIRFLAAPVPEAGRFVGAVETLIDITEESDHEKALIQSMEDYRALAEDLSDGFILVQNGRFVFVNHAYAKMLGYSDPAYFIGKRAEEFISPRMREEFTRKNIAISHGHVREKHLRWPHITRDGREVWIEGHPKLITWGNKPTVLSTLIDVTEAMSRELAIKEEASRLRRQVKSLRDSMKERYRFGEIIGKSAPMQEVYELITKAAASDANVIIYGESGTGKELVAKAIHDRSARSKGGFVPVNCSAIPETLVESEFFGYKKGAFTGAQADKRGFLDRANEGTLFLDEIGELSPDMQAKLLRAIEGHAFTPIGTTETRNSDFRIIAATHKNLVEEVQKGRMREDFFYRIHIVPIDLPPLRNRKEDIPLLMDHFIHIYDAEGKITALPGDVVKIIYDYDWPGNVRELQNAIHRFITIGRLDLVPTRKCDYFPKPGEKDSGSRNGNMKRMIKGLEKEMIHEALRQGKGNKTKAAALLGIPRKTLYRKLTENGTK
ncbi:MAG: PAS domain S-box protein [Desulfobacteraceae bacterium]|nr:MAG: PAS domain S-box protein [Desulfobacteraceae bacterium]